MFNKRVDGLGSPDEPLWERKSNRRDFGRNRRKWNGVLVVQVVDFLDSKRLPISGLSLPERIEIGYRRWSEKAMEIRLGNRTSFGAEDFTNVVPFIEHSIDLGVVQPKDGVVS